MLYITEFTKEFTSCELCSCSWVVFQVKSWKWKIKKNENLIKCETVNDPHSHTRTHSAHRKTRQNVGKSDKKQRTRMNMKNERQMAYVNVWWWRWLARENAMNFFFSSEKFQNINRRDRRCHPYHQRHRNTHLAHDASHLFNVDLKL